jgi:hypothetical protein
MLFSTRVCNLVTIIISDEKNPQHKKFSKTSVAKKAHEINKCFSNHDNDVLIFEETENGIIFLCSLRYYVRTPIYKI